jgi:hypothetical protein
MILSAGATVLYRLWPNQHVIAGLTDSGPPSSVAITRDGHNQRLR